MPVPLQVPWRWLRLATTILFTLTILACALTASEGINPHPPVEASSLAFANSVKLRVSRQGIYQLRLSDLGWEDSDLASLQLFFRDQPQPLWILSEAGETYIRFYGRTDQSQYTAQTIYTLRRGEQGGIQMASAPEAVSRTSALVTSPAVMSSLRIEENQLYQPVVNEGDHWFGDKLIAPQSQSYVFQLAGLAPGEGKIQVELWGYTSGAMEPDHHVLVSVNGKQVSDSSWDGQTRFRVEAQIPEGVLKEGDNTVTLTFPGDTEAVVEIAYLDWIEIQYPRQPQTEGGYLIFESTGQPVRLTGLASGSAIFDITTPHNITVTKVSESNPIFYGETSHRYMAVNPSGYLQPDQIASPRSDPDLLNAENYGEYLAIGPESLLEPLAPLLEQRESQGLSTQSIPLEAIYDQFNGGMPEPGAIRTFLSYAQTNWTVPPRYILLVGDASYDFKGYTSSPPQDPLPTMMVYTTHGGETGSDILIANINEDPWPDLAIGRLPARSPDQVRVFVVKTLSFEQGLPAATWKRNILAIADGQGPTFSYDAQDFLDLFPHTYNLSLIAPSPGTETAAQDIAAALEKGQLITAYFGHGSLNMWGKDQLFTREDASQLNNADRLTIMLHVTCLTGLFTHPTEESLGERLLFNPNGGAVALMAPTSLTLPGAQEFLSSAFVEGLLQPKLRRLGDVALYAWRQAPTDYPSYIDVMNTFLLFGDPALLLPAPTTP